MSRGRDHWPSQDRRARRVAALEAGRARIADPATWCTVVYARDADGAEVDPTDPGACAWCAVGALAAGGPTFGGLAILRERAWRRWNLPPEDVSDLPGHEAALELYDAAIEAARTK